MTLDDVKKYIDKGFTVFPIEINSKIGSINSKTGRKTIVPRGWNSLTAADMNKAYIDVNFTGKDVNLCAVCGLKIKDEGYLTVIDVDIPGENHTCDGRPWIKKMFSGYENILNETYTQETPSGGKHYFFYTESVINVRTDLHSYNDSFCISNVHLKTERTGLDVLGLGANITLSGSQIQRKDDEIVKYTDNGKDILKMPIQIENLLLNIVRPKKQQIIKKEKTFYMNPDKEELLKYLIFAAADGKFDSRTDWVALAAALKDGGFSIEDFEKLSFPEDDEKWSKTNRDREIESVWNSVDEDEDRTTKRSLVFWAKEYGYNSWKKIEPEDGIYIRNYEMYETQEIKPDGSTELIVKTKNLTYWDEDPNFDVPAKYFYAFCLQNGQKYLFEKENFDNSVSNSNQFFNILQSKNIYLDFTKNSPLTEQKFFNFIQNKCEQKDRISFVPEWQMDSRTIYVGEKYEPKKTGYFRKMLNIFTDIDVRSNYKRAAGILSSFLPSRFDGLKPSNILTCILAGGGKTSGAIFQSNIIEGKEPIVFNIDAQRDKKFDSLVSFGIKTIIIDNIKQNDLKISQHSSYSLLEQDITSTTLDVWIMHTAHSSIKNNKTFWLTFNTGVKMTTDIMKRSNIIIMSDPNFITTEKKNNILRDMQEIKENREKVIQDILWAFQEADKNKNSNTYKSHTRFVEWSRVMNDVLHYIYPEIEEFDFDISDEEKLEDYDVSTILDILSVVWPMRTNINKSKPGFISNENLALAIRLNSGDINQTWAKNVNSVKNYFKNKSHMVSQWFDIEYHNSAKIDGKNQRGFTIMSKIGVPDEKMANNKQNLDIYIEGIKKLSSEYKRTIFDEYITNTHVEEEDVIEEDVEDEDDAKRLLKQLS